MRNSAFTDSFLRPSVAGAEPNEESAKRERTTRLVYLSPMATRASRNRRASAGMRR